MTSQTAVHSPIVEEQEPLSQQANSGPKLARSDLIEGSREQYLKIGVPLYEASIKGDWKAAKAILNKYSEMELVRCSITENGETALHVAASAKGSKDVEKFVKNLVAMMTKEDLKLQNKTHDTALFLAAEAGNIKTVKIMMEMNKDLLTIAGSQGKIMPLYTAVLFGHEDVVKYMYNNSNGLHAEGWTSENRGWLLQKCVESDMFDVALKIVKNHQDLDTGTVLRVLAQKPEAFPETKFKIILGTINWCKHICSKMHISLRPSQNEDVGSGGGSTEPSNEPFPETKTNIVERTIKWGKHL